MEHDTFILFFKNYYLDFNNYSINQKKKQIINLSETYITFLSR